MMSKYNNLSEFEKKSIQLSIDKLFKNDSYFNISTVDKIIRILDLNVDPDIYNSLSLLHCMDYGQMGKEFKRDVINQTLRLLDLDWVDLEFKVIENDIKEDIVPQKQSKSLLKLLKPRIK